MKKFCAVFIFIILMSSIPLRVSAQSADDVSQIVDNAISEAGITPPAKEDLLKLTPSYLLTQLFAMLRQAAGMPLRLFFTLTAVILTCAAADTMRDTVGDYTKTSGIFGIVAALAGSYVILQNAGLWLSECAAALGAGSAFMVTFVPVYAGVLAMCGGVTTAPLWCGGVIAASGVLSGITSMFLPPLCNAFLALGTVSAAAPYLKIGQAANMVHMIIQKLLGLCMAVFVGLLTVQTAITAGGDAISIKTAKFAASAAVPIVGGAVGDAVAAVRSGFIALKAASGALGIAAFLMLTLPFLIKAFAVRLSLLAALGVSEMFDVTPLSGLLKCAAAVSGIIFAALVCFCVYNIIAIGVVLTLGN